MSRFISIMQVNAFFFGFWPNTDTFVTGFVSNSTTSPVKEIQPVESVCMNAWAHLTMCKHLGSNQKHTNTTELCYWIVFVSMRKSYLPIDTYSQCVSVSERDAIVIIYNINTNCFVLYFVFDFSKVYIITLFYFNTDCSALISKLVLP